MRELRYLTDDRDREQRQELVIHHGNNGDLYVSVVDEGRPALSGVRLATSGGAGYRLPQLVYGMMTAFNEIYDQAVADPVWAKEVGIQIRSA